MWSVELENRGAGGADTPATQKGRKPRLRGTATAVRVKLQLGGPGHQAGVARQARMRARGGGLLLGKEGAGGGAVDTRRARDVPMATEPLLLGGEVGGGASAGSCPWTGLHFPAGPSPGSQLSISILEEQL